MLAWIRAMKFHISGVFHRLGYGSQPGSSGCSTKHAPPRAATRSQMARVKSQSRFASATRAFSHGRRSGKPQKCVSRPRSGRGPFGMKVCRALDTVLQGGPPPTKSMRPSAAAQKSRLEVRGTVRSQRLSLATSTARRRRAMPYSAARRRKCQTRLPSRERPTKSSTTMKTRERARRA